MGFWFTEMPKSRDMSIMTYFLSFCMWKRFGLSLFAENRKDGAKEPILVFALKPVFMPAQDFYDYQ